MEENAGKLCLLVVFATLIGSSLSVQYRPSTNNNEPCAPGFEKIMGACQPCKPLYFKDSTMTGMSCTKCDYVKNKFQVEYCPCTSVQNAVIVCQNNDSVAPSSFCKRRSEVQESCIQQGGLQNPQREANSSDVLSGEFNRSATHDWSGSPLPPFSFATVSPVGDHQRHDAGLFSSTLNVLILSVAITFIAVSAIVSGVYFYRRPAGMREHGRKQPFDAAINAEQAAQLLPARGDEVRGPPVDLLMYEIAANSEEPHSSVRFHSDPFNEDSRDISYNVASLDRPADVQLDFENSTALHANPVSDRNTINFNVASVLH